jgi:hypothetical protein
MSVKRYPIPDNPMKTKFKIPRQVLREAVSRAENSKRNQKKPAKQKKARQAKNGTLSSMTRIQRSMPVTVASVVTRERGRNHIESFTDYFAACTTSTAVTAVGDTLVNTPELLCNFGARVAALATLYQKWRLRRCQFRYVSEVPTSTAGSLTMAHVSDMNYSLPAAAGLNTTGVPGTVRSLMNEISGARTFPVWSPEIRMSIPCKKEWLYTSGLNASGILANLVANGLLLVCSNSALTASTTYGRIYVDAEVELSEPDYNLAAGVASYAAFSLTPVDTSGTTIMAAALKSNNAALISAPFAVWVPSVSSTIGDQVFQPNLPVFLAYNGTNYNFFSSPEDYATSTPTVSAASTGTTPRTGQTFYFPANF